MKVRLQESGATGSLRCPKDNKLLLTFVDDDVVLESCEHYHWHAGPDEYDISEMEERREIDENEEEPDEQEWYEILRQNYVAEVSVEGAQFYLIPVEKAVKEA